MRLNTTPAPPSHRLLQNAQTPASFRGRSLRCARSTLCGRRCQPSRSMFSPSASAISSVTSQNRTCSTFAVRMTKAGVPSQLAGDIAAAHDGHGFGFAGEIGQRAAGRAFVALRGPMRQRGLRQMWRCRSESCMCWHQGQVVVCSSSCRSGRSSDKHLPVKRRLLQRGKPVVPQPAQIAVKERAQIRDAVFQHRHPVDAHAEGKALPFRRINAAACSTLGCTMPEPRTSSQSSPSPTFTVPPSHEHWISTSAEGSVNGKCEARKRVLTLSTSKNADKNSSSTHFRFAMRCLCRSPALRPDGTSACASGHSRRGTRGPGR